MDDATITRAIVRAKQMGYGSIIVGNAFALRTAYPIELLRHDAPIGPANDIHLRRILLECKRRKGIAVAGWGVDGVFLQRHKVISKLAQNIGVELHCLGVTKDGHPMHPLYRPYAQKLIKWAPING